GAPPDPRPTAPPPGTAAARSGTRSPTAAAGAGRRPRTADPVASARGEEPRGGTRVSGRLGRVGPRGPPGWPRGRSRDRGRAGGSYRGRRGGARTGGEQQACRRGDGDSRRGVTLLAGAARQMQRRATRCHYWGARQCPARGPGTCLLVILRIHATLLAHVEHRDPRGCGQRPC